MNSLFSNQAVRDLKEDAALRVYTSQLLGQNPALVLHGGGNTSVKTRRKNFLGAEEDILLVKGSGGDLATINETGFSPCRLDVLLQLAALPELSDTDMVREMRASMTNPDAPTPSIEAIVHAVIAPKFVDHTHANAILGLTNQPNGAAAVQEVYGSRIIIVPYVMPGFLLAKTIAHLTAKADWSKLEGLILMNHGIFTFAESAGESYERMIQLVSEAEAWLEKNGGGPQAVALGKSTLEAEDLKSLAACRKYVTKLRGKPVLAMACTSDEAAGFAQRSDAKSLGTRGPLTPDHTIRTKRVPIFLDPSSDGPCPLQSFAEDFAACFKRHQAGQTMLDAAPRWTIWAGKGTIAFGTTLTESKIVSDITAHTVRTIQQAEAAGGWQPLGEKDLFEIEYWELEQAKLRKAPVALPLQGKVALVSGAAAGIGRAIAQSLHAQGAVVVGFDLNPAITERLVGEGLHGVVLNLTDYDRVKAEVENVIRQYGGLDILVSNAGIFTAGANFEDMDPANWAKSMEVNLTSHMRLLQFCVPYLRHGIDPTAIFVGSRNVKAPGAGAGSYSCAKAAVTQLVRVAALELAKDGVRVNIIHPDAVFDTELWTPEALAKSAERYGITVEEYKTRNLMKAEITSKDIGAMVCAMAGPAFAKTTGAQIPVDGGNDRVI